MQAWMIHIMNSYGYWGILLLIAIENIFPPIPSEVILTFGGFMTTFTSMKIWGVVAFATVGSVLGALVLYSIGRCLTPERLERWLDSKLGHMLRLKKEDVRKAEGWFVRRGKKTVFFCRFIPIVRSLISIPAGMSRMNIGAFLALTTMGTVIWNVVLVYPGAITGQSWGIIVDYMNTYSAIAGVVLLVLLVIFCFIFYKKRLAAKKHKEE